MKLTKADKNVAMLKFDELVINSLILSMWHAYKNYNFELYIYIYIYKMRGNPVKKKKPGKICCVRRLKNTST